MVLWLCYYFNNCWPFYTTVSKCEVLHCTENRLLPIYSTHPFFFSFLSYSSLPAWSFCLPVRLLLESGDSCTKTRLVSSCIHHVKLTHTHLFIDICNYIFFFSFQISKEMITFYDSVYDKASNTGLNDEQKQAAGAVLKVFHETVSSPHVLRGTIIIKLTQTPLKPNDVVKTHL